MAPSATAIHEVEHINHLVLTEKDLNIEHNIDDHVAFGTLKSSVHSNPSLHPRACTNPPPRR
jgi:hypothetical protein